MLVYLASPYTPKNGECIQDRVDAACKAAAHLMEQGHVVFAPVPHSHYIADYLGPLLRMDHDFWMGQDLTILRRCDQLTILRLPGWGRSKGINRELQEAQAHNIPVTYMDPV